jgi:transcriptional regulator with XRE-family HTH domain
MDGFTQSLRQRTNELGLSLAEAARRSGLSERRMANYAAGSREPDLATLVRIAGVLDVTTDQLLGIADVDRPSGDDCDALRQQIAADIRQLDDDALKLVADVVRTTVMHHQRSVPKSTSRRSR